MAFSSYLTHFAVDRGTPVDSVNCDSSLLSAIAHSDTRESCHGQFNPSVNCGSAVSGVKDIRFKAEVDVYPRCFRPRHV